MTAKTRRSDGDLHDSLGLSIGHTCRNQALIPLYSHGPLRDECSASLPIERPLVLEPPSIPLDTPDLLTVIVWYRIVRTRASRIYSMLLNSLEESSLLLHELDSDPPVQRPPDRVAEEGPNEPAEECDGEGGDAHGDEGVGGDGLGDHVGGGREDGDREAAAGEGYQRSDDGGREGVAPAGFAEFEKGIPV
jgi:hypothetical protein